MSEKPLGHKSYGSIPHLPGSRRGPADKGVNDGQYRICCERVRDKHDLIIVQEKLDGSNVGITRIEGRIVPLTRSGWRAEMSQFEMHQLFADWVYADQARWLELLHDGERICGEWLAQAHGTRYHLFREDGAPLSPFVAFDLMRGSERSIYAELQERITMFEVQLPPLIHVGGPLSIEHMMQHLSTSWGYGARDLIEGAIWRVERRGKTEFLAKYVRSDKVDGAYLPEISGGEAVWNWRP